MTGSRGTEPPHNSAHLRTSGGPRRGGADGICHDVPWLRAFSSGTRRHAEAQASNAALATQEKEELR